MSGRGKQEKGAAKPEKKLPEPAAPAEKKPQKDGGAPEKKEAASAPAPKAVIPTSFGRGSAIQKAFHAPESFSKDIVNIQKGLKTNKQKLVHWPFPLAVSLALDCSLLLMLCTFLFKPMSY